MPTEEREYRSSMGRRANEHVAYERTAFSVPEGVQRFSLGAAGVKRIDIVNYRVGKGNPWADAGTLHPERTFFTHKNVGPNEDSYVCLAKTLKEPCPICEFRAKMAKRADSDPKMLKDLEPKERQLWWVFDHSEAAKGWQIWEVSYHTFGKLLEKRIKNRDDDEPYDLFAMATKGMTLKLDVQEKALPGGKFYDVAAIDFKPRTEQYPKELYDQLACLDDLVIITPYEKLKAIFLQTPGGGDDEEVAPKAPPKAAKAAPPPPPAEDEEPTPLPKKARPAPPPADEDEPPPPKKTRPAPPPAEEEDPAPKPAKAAKPAPAPAAAGDDDWDDWDEPAAPAKVAKKPAAAAEEE